jgi:hypothetical protein
MISSTGIAIGSIPFLKQLFAKMSANVGAMITRNPNSPSAHGACSREEPQPKFLPATSIDAPSYRGSFSTNDGFG